MALSLTLQVILKHLPRSERHFLDGEEESLFNLKNTFGYIPGYTLEVDTSDIRPLTAMLAVLPTYSMSTVLTVHLGLTHLWRLRSSNPFYNP